MVMEQHPQDDPSQGHSIDQNKMLSTKVSNLEQADTPFDSSQPQTAAPCKQSHPSLLPSQLRGSEPQDNPGHIQCVDQVNIAPVEVADDVGIPRPIAAPEKQSDPSLRPRSSHTLEGNEQSPFSTDGSQISLQQEAPSPTTAFPQDGPVLLEYSQDTRKLPCTPGCKAQPRRYGPGTGQIRSPVNMTPSRIYRPLCSPGATPSQNTPVTPSDSETRILPIGELITTRSRRTYTLCANKPQKPNHVSTQIVMTNINSTTSFKSYSGVSRRSPTEVLENFGGLLRAQGIELMSLNVVKQSFVAVGEVLRDGILYVVR